MSTRSILAFDTEKGVRGVYVHSDGYPEGPSGRLVNLDALIERDGVSKVATTVLAHSHWHFLFAERESYDEAHYPAQTVVPGYGVFFDHQTADRYFTTDQLKEWWDSEYVYLVSPDGSFKWAALGVGHDDLTWESLEWKVGVDA